MMASSIPTSNGIYLFRLQALVKDVGILVLRNLIDQELDDVPFQEFVALNRRRITGIRPLNHAYIRKLYTSKGDLKLEDIDFKLACLLLQEFFYSRLSRDYVLYIQRLQNIHNKILHMQSTSAMDQAKFEANWARLEKILLTLNRDSKRPIEDLDTHIDRCKLLLSGVTMEAEEHIEKRTTSLKTKIETKKQRSPKDTCIFDGRPILLADDDIDCLDKSLKWFAKGGFGEIYKNDELFEIPVAVKKVRTENDESIRDIATSEMIVSRIRHQFILPLLATCSREEQIWFISPYCENGDLTKAIRKDINHNTLKLSRTISIVFQLAKAIEYIHTPVENVRDAIIHKDIASSNVLLDAQYNARLIDFGIAREKNDLTNRSYGRDAYAHPDVGISCACETWDHFSFGVVIREMLTSLGPNGHGDKYLKNMSAEEIQHKLKKPFKDNGMAQQLNKISTDCLKTDEAVPFETIVHGLKDLVREINLKEELDAEKCHLCMINPKARDNQTRNHKCINVCVSCEKNSFLNPIKCHCGVEITPIIGHGWGALLVAGDDTKDPTKAKAFLNDVLKFKNVITSKAPLIMGISEENIQVVVPDNKQKLSQKMVQAMESLPRDLQTLIIYISCHGQRKDDTNDFRFRFSDNDTLTLNTFDDTLDQCKENRHNLHKVMLFFDCCHPPLIRIKGIDQANVIQLNACEEGQKAQCTEKGSIFTKLLIQGLKAKAEGSPCGKSDCNSCKKYWDLRSDYVTVERLLEYINDHIDKKKQTPRLLFNGKHDDFKIAYYTDEEVLIEFTEVNSESLPEETHTLKLEYFKDMQQMETQLCEKFKRNKDDFNVVITSCTFRKDNTSQTCDSAEKIILAWVNRQPLLVSFEPKCEALPTADTGTTSMVIYDRSNAS